MKDISYTTRTLLLNPQLKNCQRNNSTLKISTVFLLRLLTALEEYLGSLGPKFVEQLSKTLQAEKTFPLDFYAIILSPENCIILETAMEKFKGILVAGILEDSKHITILRKAIDEIEFLLFLSCKLTTN